MRKPRKEALKEKTTNVVITALSKSNEVQAGRLRMVLTNNLSGIGEDGYLLPQV